MAAAPLVGLSRSFGDRPFRAFIGERPKLPGGTDSGNMVLVPVYGGRDDRVCGGALLPPEKCGERGGQGEGGGEGGRAKGAGGDGVIDRYRYRYVCV